MRFPLPYFFSSVFMTLAIVLGAYLMWHSYTAERLMLNRFPAVAPTEAVRQPASVPDDYYAYAYSDNTPPVLYSVGEMLVNVRSADNKNHYLRFRLDFEMFDEGARALIEEADAGVKDTILETLREQNFSQLSTLEGKLYFKEELTAKVNAFLNRPAVRGVHFSSFYLQ